MKAERRLWTLAPVLLLASLLFAAPPAAAQGVEAEVDSVSAMLEDARSRDLHLIAPRRFETAASKLAEARDRLEAGGNIGDIRDRLAEARGALDRAEGLREVGSVLLRDAIGARDDALAANAPEYAPELWSDAASRLRDAGRSVEDGDQNDAREEAREARARFQAAEVKAIKNSLLTPARELRSDSRDRDAHERAPRTYALADSLLERAEVVLQEDPSRQSRARSLAERSARQFRHAMHIAALDDTFRRDGGIEELTLRAEAQIERIASRLNFEPRFDEGLAPATDEVLSAIESLQTDRDGLREQLASLQEELKSEQARVDSLRQRLAQLGERQARVSEELEERRRREATLKEVRAIFGSDEAEVLLRGDELLIRLIGLQFPSASSEIRPRNFSLLTKVQQVIREFPDAPVTIQGHTDSRGNDEYNQSLSQRRAIAVREYLLANMALSADRVAAQGFGESRPIATNETEEGRAQNRRIDVVLDLSEP